MAGLPRAAPLAYATHCMVLRIEIEPEDDGRWLAEVVNLPGVMVYGATRDEAWRHIQVLALRVMADRLESGELDLADFAPVEFELAEAA